MYNNITKDNGKIKFTNLIMKINVFFMTFVNNCWFKSLSLEYCFSIVFLIFSTKQILKTLVIVLFLFWKQYE